MNLKKVVWRVFSALLTLLLLIFSYFYIRDLLVQVNGNDLRFRWSFVVLSVLLVIFSYAFLSINWWLSGRLLNREASGYQILAFVASQPYKYLPTSIFTFSSRAYFGMKLGLTIKQASIAQVFENASLIFANFYLFLILCVVRFHTLAGMALVLISAVVLYALLHSSKSFNLRYKKRNISLPLKSMSQMFLVSTFGWFLSGCAFMALNTALGLQLDVLSLLAANTIAFSLSMLAFFAPGGIGVRELVYTKFAVDSTAIIAWRIMIFTVDIVAGVAAYLVARKKYVQD